MKQAASPTYGAGNPSPLNPPGQPSPPCATRKIRTAHRRDISTLEEPLRPPPRTPYASGRGCWRRSFAAVGWRDRRCAVRGIGIINTPYSRTSSLDQCQGLALHPPHLPDPNRSACGHRSWEGNYTSLAFTNTFENTLHGGRSIIDSNGKGFLRAANP